MSARPVICHVVYRFAVGGMENGVVNLINATPDNTVRHVVMALTDVTDFRKRITYPDVEFVELHKPPGQTIRLTPQLFRQFRRLQADVVHTRNIGTLEVQVAAALARVPVRLHGEHGWDMKDLGANTSHLSQRRLLRRFVHRQIALSKPTERYLTEQVGVPADRVTHIYNGVDTDRFTPPLDGRREALDGRMFTDLRCFVVGTVGRSEPVKNQMLLAEAFAHLRQHYPQIRNRVKLAIVGDGKTRPDIELFLAQNHCLNDVWMPGTRHDVDRVMRGFDLFVLPSLNEGISNTILEAMATGLPVIATDVGGNPELVADGRTGFVVPTGSPDAMARKIVAYVEDYDLWRKHARNARLRAETQFSLRHMVGEYYGLYARMLRDAGRPCEALERALIQMPHGASALSGHASDVVDFGMPTV